MGPMYESPEQVYLLRAMAEQIWNNGREQPGESRFNGNPVAVVGMSTTPDIQVMTHASQAVGDFNAFKHRVGLSVATNYSASLGPNGFVAPSTHAEVQAAGRSIQEVFGKLVAELITNSSQLS
jgi:purine nucleoside phosphorylase